MALKVCKSDEVSKEECMHEIMLLRDVRDKYPSDPKRDRIGYLIDDFEIKKGNNVHRCMVKEVIAQDLNTLIHEYDQGIHVNNVKRIIKQVLEGLDYLHTKCK